MTETAMSDFDKAEKAAGLFAKFVGPLLDRYMKLKERNAPAEDTARAKRAYERAHGKHNERLADMELEAATAQLTDRTAPAREGDRRTHG